MVKIKDKETIYNVTLLHINTNQQTKPMKVLLIFLPKKDYVTKKKNNN